MSEPSSRPSDPSEPSAEELHPAAPATVRSCRSVEWRKTPSGGQARLREGPLTKTLAANTCHFVCCTGQPLSDWLPCSDPRDAESLFELPAPDHIAEEPSQGAAG